MKVMSYEEAKAYYTPVIEGEINRCNNMIAMLENCMREMGETEEAINTLNEFIKERDMWMSGLE